MRVTGFQCVNERGGDQVPCDAYGNNVALRCLDCGHPLLAIILPKQNRRGSSPKNRARCPHCQHSWWVSADPTKKLLTIRACEGTERTLDASRT
jgi:hypothetical protein